MNRLFLILIVGLLVPGCVQPQGTTDEKTESVESAPNTGLQGDNLRVLTLEISGMSCPACPKGITSFLLELDGIIRTDITLEQKGGTVEYDSAKITAEEIVGSEIFQGVYRAEIIDDRAIEERG
ncbi:MAG: heavy-metal-associated domain-containing protein [Candidatus Hydrothermarchaeales archaeon]